MEASVLRLSWAPLALRHTPIHEAQQPRSLVRTTRRMHMASVQDYLDRHCQKREGARDAGVVNAVENRLNLELRTRQCGRDAAFDDGAVS